MSDEAKSYVENCAFYGVSGVKQGYVTVGLDGRNPPILDFGDGDRAVVRMRNLSILPSDALNAVLAVPGAEAALHEWLKANG